MRRALFTILLVMMHMLGTAASFAQNARPKEGLVPDAATAVRIAEAIWLPIYGKAIYEKRPFVAKLQGDVWVVSGTLPMDTLGGVPEAHIAKRDARVLKVIHGQ
jgi:hypothetical protein